MVKPLSAGCVNTNIWSPKLRQSTQTDDPVCLSTAYRFNFTSLPLLCIIMQAKKQTNKQKNGKGLGIG